jgi:hypothetical protein
MKIIFLNRGNGEYTVSIRGLLGNTIASFEYQTPPNATMQQDKILVMHKGNDEVEIRIKIEDYLPF